MLVSVLVLKDKLRWTDGAAFLLIFAGVAVSMLGRGKS
jgi:drug/metabolite transporter (DMT)-like permease